MTFVKSFSYHTSTAFAILNKTFVEQTTGDMAYKSTVAVIGATSTLGKTLVSSMVHRHRLLLMDASAKELTALQNELGQYGSAVEII